ncbi:MAG: hypothetical protein KDB88_12095 [Flavobacteriales bacterium]|nr:hypothetical protein [Flavobacteriales bacterium]
MASVAVLFSACSKDPSPPQWDVDLLAPLFITELTVSDLIADSLLDVAPDGALTLRFTDELFGFKLDTAFEVPDTSIAYRFALPIPGSLNFPAGSTFFSEEQTSDLGITDVQLRFLELREGLLHVDLTNMVQSNMIATFSLPSASLNGQPAVLTEQVGPGTPQNPAMAAVTRDLSGYWFDLRGPQFNTVNTLTSLVSTQLDPNGSGATVTSQDSVIAIANYDGLVPAYARGFFGQRTIEVGPDVSEVDVFDGIIAGALDLDQVQAELTIRNGIGVDARVHIAYLRSLNANTGTTVDLMHPVVGAPINLNRAIDLGNSPAPSTWSVTLDELNSNIDLFVENLPTALEYELDVLVNPLGDVSNGNDFLYYESELIAELGVDIPLRLALDQFTLQSTVRVDLPGSEENHGLQYGTLYLFATNGFPFSADLTLEIVDQAGTVHGVLPSPVNVPAGTLGVDDLVSSPTTVRREIEVAAEELDLLYQHDRLRITSVFNTAGSGHVSILDGYQLDLQLTARANYIVNGDE